MYSVRTSNLRWSNQLARATVASSKASRLPMNDFGFGQAIHLLGQAVVAGVAGTAHPGFDASLGKTLGMADRDMFGTSAQMVNQLFCGGPAWLQGFSRCLQHEVGVGSG